MASFRDVGGPCRHAASWLAPQRPPHPGKRHSILLSSSSCTFHHLEPLAKCKAIRVSYRLSLGRHLPSQESGALASGLTGGRLGSHFLPHREAKNSSEHGRQPRQETAQFRHVSRQSLAVKVAVPFLGLTFEFLLDIRRPFSQAGATPRTSLPGRHQCPRDVIWEMPRDASQQGSTSESSVFAWGVSVP